MGMGWGLGGGGSGGGDRYVCHSSGATAPRIPDGSRTANCLAVAGLARACVRSVLSCSSSSSSSSASASASATMMMMMMMMTMDGWMNGWMSVFCTHVGYCLRLSASYRPPPPPGGPTAHFSAVTVFFFSLPHPPSPSSLPFPLPLVPSDLIRASSVRTVPGTRT